MKKTIDINKLISSLEDLQNSITQVSEDIKDFEKILSNYRFPIAIDLFCYQNKDYLIDIYLAWDKDESDNWALLATKIWEDETGIVSKLVRISNLKIIQKAEIYKYLPQFIEKIEEKANELRNILIRINDGN